MKYVILVYGNATTRQMWENMTEEQRLEGWKGHIAVREGLAASGELVLSEALADTSLTKRVTGTVVTDGPFAEVKEHLAGFYVVDCENIDRAIEHAGKLPESTFGLVEVRPVLDGM
ncbi:YciI family protein [Actinocrispum sp. NPDC049592]|uniref:YciI family protein n=1 Tax=Actinocrispum sp. NPDC049592 TaxID=3154835 RepID=UPI0034313C33